MHAKYIELVSTPQLYPHINLSWRYASSLPCAQFSELKKQEREHAKEKQKLVKDKDAGPPFFPE